jgi:chemotaxis regulatin CheY-phosphate phosphatase CheZ
MAEDLNEMCDIACGFLDNSLPALRAQMEAADKRTEKAADSILTHCEQMMLLLKDCPAETQAQLQMHINSIFEASNFQDLVSQHINEIRRVVDALSEDLGVVRNNLQAGQSGGQKSKREKRPERADAHLLNGPSTNVE